MRTKVYVDGYNLYYGCLKGTEHKWLDLYVLFKNWILPSSAPLETELVGIKFFTAPIQAKAAKADDSVSSQARYHQALKNRYSAEIEVVRGYYTMDTVNAKVVDLTNPERRFRECETTLVWKLEEKQSDVNLALHAYHDAITSSVEQVVIVTNDTDIAPVVEMLKKHTSVTVGVVIPTRKHVRYPNGELTKHADWTRTHITDEELAGSQLPPVVMGKRKPTIKPESW